MGYLLGVLIYEMCQQIIFLGDLVISDKMSGLMWIIGGIQDYDECEVLLETHVDNCRYLLGCLGGAIWDMFWNRVWDWFWTGWVGARA